MDANAASLAAQLGADDALELVGGEPRLPLVVARVRDSEPFTGTDLVGELEKRGWMVPAYELPPDNADQQVIRMLVTINQTRELADALAGDIRDAIDKLRRRAAGDSVGRTAARGHGY